jgi:alpha-ketoglutarate-dependent taurine dioxygenase
MKTKKITVSDLEVVSGLPLILNVQDTGLKASDWVTQHCEEVQQILETHGAILIRGLKIYASNQFGQLLEKLFADELLDYVYRSTPRTQMRGRVYTATEYPATEVIPQHNENAYSRQFPGRIGFLCLLPPETGGETPIGDAQQIYQRLGPDIREKFESKGILYIRNYSDLDLPWTEVFQTESKAEVEQYCRDNELEFEWLQDNGLRTKQINPATIIHPVSGEKLWFNQAHLFHVSSLAEEVQQTLLSTLGEARLPRNTFYGDGSPIEPAVLETIRAVYVDTKVSFSWQKSDLLLLDNLRFTHGREAFTGPRKVLTGMACPHS